VAFGQPSTALTRRSTMAAPNQEPRPSAT
jgi:hypothetical protein